MVVQRHSEMVPGELILKTHAEQGVFWVLGGAELGKGSRWPRELDRATVEYRGDPTLVDLTRARNSLP